MVLLSQRSSSTAISIKEVAGHKIRVSQWCVPLLKRTTTG